MRKKEAFAFTVLLAMLSMNMIVGSTAYAMDIYSVEDASTIVKWEVIHAPESAFSMYFTGAGNCLVESDSNITFSLGDTNPDFSGLLEIGNVSILTNDTDVSRDLVLGIGIYSSFEPGLFVNAGPVNIDTLNDSAYTAAARVSGNFMNGTMTSIYENVTIGLIEYEAITFDYAQDAPIAGDPQRTQLTYDIDTGILLYANTSYWFGEGFEPYWLEIQFLEMTYEGGDLLQLDPYLITLVSVIVISVILAIIWLNKRN